MSDRIEINPTVMVGKPVIRGTRIPVELVLRKLSEGATAEDLLDAHPSHGRRHQGVSCLRCRYDRTRSCFGTGPVAPGDLVIESRYQPQFHGVAQPDPERTENLIHSLYAGGVVVRRFVALNLLRLQAEL